MTPPLVLAGPAGLPLAWGLLAVTLLGALGVVTWHSVRAKAVAVGVAAALAIMASAYAVTALWVGNPSVSVVTGDGRARVMCVYDSVTAALSDPGGTPAGSACRRHGRERTATGAGIWLLTLAITGAAIARRRPLPADASHPLLPSRR